ncbi:MAG TPA: methylaspartate ammonia-lyase [Clostridiaceae bacterium]|nr:methylaspartate ammonia-lyase [Clostridiaceae bacterium]
MKIVKVVCAPGRTGFFFDDQKAIKRGAKSDGFFYVGSPETTGFTAIRQAGESISLMLVLEDGSVAWGDCAAVQYSGAGGRDPLFLAEDFIPVIIRDIAPKLEGRVVNSFRDTMVEFEKMTDLDGNRLHTAIRYGLSQAILDCVAKTKHKLMCEVIADEYGTTVSEEMIPIFSQTGDMRHDNADKMILKHVHVLPHALINNFEKLGSNGDALVEYTTWLRDRILNHRQDPAYHPVIHIDVYGMIGELFGYENIDIIADYLLRLEEAASPFALRIEGPIDAGSRESQLEWLAKLTRRVDERGINVELVADEWCNTVDDVRAFVDAGAGHMIQIKTPDLGSLHNTADAVLYCKENGAGAYMGGTCNETNRSAEASVHVAMAMKPDQILAKPGMGVDEGVMIVYNEMQRILALRGARK